MSARGAGGLKLLVGAVTLAGCDQVAGRGTPSWERELFVRLHTVPRAVDFALWAPMQAGSAWGPPVAAALAWRRPPTRPATAGLLITGWGGWWLAKLVKKQVGRGRPKAALPGNLVRASATSEGLGFVSGHSTVAFACASTLGPYLPRPVETAGYGLASTVAMSRVVVGAHLPLDAVGGAALGLALAGAWQMILGAAPRHGLAIDGTER